MTDGAAGTGGSCIGPLRGDGATSSPSLRDPRLAALYARTPGAVAFVDESYRAKVFDGERAFYLLSAVTFATEQLDQVREVLTDIVGGLFWHTTEAFKIGRAGDIADMVGYVAEQVDWSVVTVEATITRAGGMDEARQVCLAALTREVARGTGPCAVRLLVADKVRDEHVNRVDQRTVAHLRSAGDIDANVTLYHGHMGTEPVLWTADVIAWAARRVVAIDDGRWIAPVRDVLTVIDARTGTPLDMKQPQAAAATPGAQQTTGKRRGQSIVAGASLSPQPPPQPGFTPGSTVLDDLVRQATELRRRWGHQGGIDGNTPAAVARRVTRARDHPPVPPPTSPPTPRR